MKDYAKKERKKSLQLKENKKLQKLFREEKRRDKKGKVCTVFTMTCLALSATGCMGGGYGGNYDVVLLGTKQGMDALADHNIGLVNEAKTTADKKGAHYILREEQEKTNRIKAINSGGLFNWLSKKSQAKNEQGAK